MNEFQEQIYKTIDILTEQKLKGLGFDISKRGKVISVNSNVAIVQIDGEEYTCKLRRGINVIPNDIVYVKFPQNNESDKYIETILGINEVAETIEITAEEILNKLKTVDGVGSELDADMLDGKHASEFALIGDLGDINISGETLVQNINLSTAIIDDDNLSLNVNDAINKKHSHANLTLLETITQSLIDGWNSAVTHISDNIKHITSGERALWNTVSNKTDLGHTHTESNISNLDKYTKSEVDTKLLTKLNTNLKGANNGIAELDSTGKVPSNQLPSYVDDVLEYTNLASFPTIGESGKIYIAINTNITYRWSGTAYVPIGSDLALGETSSTAYRGDRGKIAYDHSQITGNPHGITKTNIDLGNVDNVKQATKSEFDIHNNDDTRHMTTEEKDKLSNIENNANNYTLPIATSQTLGGIKIGSNLLVAQDGTLSAVSGDERTSFIIKQEMFVATEGQTLFNLTKGNYQPNTNTIAVYLYGGKQPNIILNEISTSSFEITEHLNEGDVLIVEYFELSGATPYPIHGSDHLTDGYDPIPKVTTSSDGLMTKEDKTKLNGIEQGANKYVHPSTHSLDMITETSTKKILTSDEKSKISEIDNKVDKVDGKGLSTNDYTTVEKNKLAGISAGAEVNQNAFSNIKIGTSTISADNKTDTIELIAGTGITLTPDTVNDKLTISGVNQYEHPETHPANMIVESSAKQFVSDTEKSTWNTVDNKVDNSRVLTDVPANAKFTDTITTINGKTGAITKADIVALGIPSQDTNITYTAGEGLILTGTVFTPDFGTGAGKVVQGDDSRLSDARTPKPHNHTKSEITDFPTLSSVATSGNYNDLTNKPTIPTDTNQLTKTDVYTKTEVNNLLSNAGQGDMMKAIYDTNNNGIVDNAEKVNGFTVGASVPVGAKFTDTTYGVATTSSSGLMSGTDKTNLDNNTAARHTHTNKSVIDKFTEVDNKPYYNGEEIGGGTSAIIKSEEIISTEGQTVFTLTKGIYAPNENKLAIYIWGVKQHSNAFIETSTTSFTLSSGLKSGDRVIAEWFETSPSIKGNKGEKGDKGDAGEKGEKGIDGKDGYTPQKGVDYYTDADKAEMVSAVMAALPVYEGEVESV